MADYLTTDTEITSIANALRTASRTSDSIVYPNGFLNLLSQGIIVNLSNDTVTPATLLSGKTAHNSSGTLITGTMEQTITNVTVSNGSVSKISGTADDYLLTLS